MRKSMSDRRSSDNYWRGYETGRKARQRGKPEPRHTAPDGSPRDPRWIEGMQSGYRSSESKPSPKEIVTTRIDAGLRDAAIAANINKSGALEMALRILTDGTVDQLHKVYGDEITSMIIGDGVTILDAQGKSYTAPTQLEALLAFLIG